MHVQSNRVIGDAGIQLAPEGATLDIRLPWYRSLPLSTVEIGDVTIDGASVPLDAISFELEGKRYALSELEEQVSHVWYVLDSAFLHLPAIGPGSHEVSVTMFLYPPYIRGLKRPVRDSRTLTIQTQG